jgi:hypothetical protein
MLTNPVLYRKSSREMIAEMRDNGQLDWSHFRG